MSADPPTGGGRRYPPCSPGDCAHPRPPSPFTLHASKLDATVNTHIWGSNTVRCSEQSHATGVQRYNSFHEKPRYFLRREALSADRRAFLLACLLSVFLKLDFVQVFQILDLILFPCLSDVTPASSQPRSARTVAAARAPSVGVVSS